MAEAGIGVDIVEISRFEEILQRTPGFVPRMFTDEERAYCDSSNRPAAHYASRFAAREAEAAIRDAGGTSAMLDLGGKWAADACCQAVWGDFALRTGS